MVSTKYSGYGLQDNLCVMAFLDAELIRKYVAPQRENREILVQMTTEYCRCLAKQDVTLSCQILVCLHKFYTK